MQWSPDRNAGFSHCTPGRLYLPVIMDPVYGYQSLNVEAEMRGNNSLLQWTRNLLAIRPPANDASIRKGNLQKRIARHHAQTKRRQVQVANDFGAQHARDVGSCGSAATPCDLLGDAAPAYNFATLEYQGREPGAGKIRGSGEAVVSSSDDYRVVAVFARNPQPLSGARQRPSGPST